MRDPAAVAALAATATVLLLVVLRAALGRRSLARRLANVVGRLDDAGVVPHDRRLESVLSSLEHAAESAVGRTHDAAATADRLRQALGAVHLGVVVCDESGRVVARNPEAARFVGARHSDALAEQEIDGLLQAALAGEEQRRTLDLYGPPRRTLVLAGVPLDDGHRLVGAVAVIEDVSERRRVDAMRRDFVANISHELKTPVGALALLAETLAVEEDLDVTRRLASRMLGEATRVGRMIEDLLDLSRIEAEEAPRREPVAVHLVMAEAVERARPAAEMRGVRIEVGEPPRERAVLGDRRQLVSALFNLLENAVKYSDRGSSVELWAGGDEAWVELVVRDHGIGIPSRDLERIFERFYRVDRARSRETGGTGLGLAIVRHVAGNHGGEVGVDSREGEGSTFVLRLPAGPASRGAPAEPAGAQARATEPGKSR